MAALVNAVLAAGFTLPYRSFTLLPNVALLLFAGASFFRQRRIDYGGCGQYVMLMIRRFNGKVLALQSAPVAQLDRASDFESAGRPFESGRVHFLNTCSASTYASYSLQQFNGHLGP